MPALQWKGVRLQTTAFMVMTYILYCIRIATKPCKYFQFNAPYFNATEGIFSKIDLDRHIPDRWRLQQFYDDGVRQPDRYPAFVKPEWGQNAKGIYKASSPVELETIRQRIATSRVNYLIQSGAPEKREFEIFSMRHHEDKNRYAILTITEAVNECEQNPINGIYNKDTRYEEVTDRFNAHQKEKIWASLCQIGAFYISRVCARADSMDALVAGQFHIIEINLFLPMPINLLDRKYRRAARRKTIRHYMLCMARLTKARDTTRTEKPVFTKIMLYDRNSRILNYLRTRL